MTSGDPLGGAPTPSPAAAPPPPAAPPRPEAPPAGYGTGPVPPGALRPPGAGGPGGGLAAPARPPLVLAEWWRRAVALLVDGLIVGVIGVVLITVFGGVFSVGFLGGDEVGVVSLILGLLAGAFAVFVAALLYAPLIMARTNGKTLGKMATGCRVVRVDGRPVEFGWALLREAVVKGLGFGVAGAFTFGIAQLLQFLWPLWDDENRALHDFIVRSRVVRD